MKSQVVENHLIVQIEKELHDELDKLVLVNEAEKVTKINNCTNCVKVTTPLNLFAIKYTYNHKFTHFGYISKKIIRK